MILQESENGKKYVVRVDIGMTTMKWETQILDNAVQTEIDFLL